MSANTITLDSAEAIQAEFNERADRWEKETAIHSAPGASYLHSDYMAIIAKGVENPNCIIPLILKRICLGGGDWFSALENITGEKPAHDSEDIEAAIRTWHEWAKQRGLIKKRRCRALYSIPHLTAIRMLNFAV